MRIKALKEKVTATATLLLFSPKTVFAANEIQNAINSSKSSSFDNLDNFLQRMVDMADGCICIYYKYFNLARNFVHEKASLAGVYLYFDCTCSTYCLVTVACYY